MIYQITHELLSKPFILEQIYADMELHYYWSDDYSEAFYITLAQAGFVNVSLEQNSEQYLLCEIQKAYAVLHLENLQISKSMKRLQRNANYTFSFNTAFDDVLACIQKSHENCWMVDKYASLMQKLHAKKSEHFELISCELFDDDTKELIAGEIGYFTANNVYTSLSGFSLKEKKYNNWGKLQLILLGEYLKERKVYFWNLGHPYMQYKLDLGAKVMQRDQFLAHWYDGFENQ